MAPPQREEEKKKIKENKERKRGEKKKEDRTWVSRASFSVTVVLLLRRGRIGVREVPGD